MGNNLAIGATVDVGAINEGMANVQEITKTAANGIAISFQEASQKTKAALRGISEDVKQSASNVSAESLRVAEATKIQTAAMADLRRAMTVARDANVDAAQSSSLLAAVQQKVKAAAVEVAEAKKAEAEAVAKAAEEEALSQNVIVRAFQRAAAEVSEITAEIRERAVEAAESGGLAEGGGEGGFGLLGGLAGGFLGTAIATDFASHMLDEVAKLNVELDHLHIESGLSVQSLAGLQQIVKEMGGEWEPIATGLVRLNRAFAEAESGSKKYQQSFEEIGVQWQSLKDASPEDKLNAVSAAFAHTSDVGKSAAAAISLFGKGGVALIPVLKEQGDQLETNIKRTGEMTGITDESAAASRRWTQDTARLSAEFRSVMMPVIEHADPVIRSVALVFEVVAAAILSAAEAAATAAVAIGSGLKSVGILALDVIRGNWADLVSDAQSAKNRFVDVWKAGFGEIVNNIKAIQSEASAIHWNAPTLPEAAEGAGDDGGGGGGGGRTGAAAATAGATPTLEPQLDTAYYKESQREFVEALQEEANAAKEAAKQQADAYRSARDEEIRIAQEGYHDAERDSAEQVRLGQITADQRLVILRKAADEEYRIAMDALHAKELVDQEEVNKYQQDLNREVELTRQHNRQIVQLNNQSAEQSMQGWQKLWDGMTQQMNRVLLDMLNGHKNLAQQLAQVWNGIVQTFARNVLKMAEQYLIGLALQKQGQKSQILGDAKTAAANTYAAVSAIPVVGPVLAPPAAAGAFAAVLAFESFNEGGVVTAGNGAHVPVLAKAGERVLTPSQTQNFETLVNQGSTNSRSNTFNLHYNGQVNAFDRSGMRSTLQSHAEDILSIVRQGYQEGKLA
jgi:hypothetical protein